MTTPSEDTPASTYLEDNTQDNIQRDVSPSQNTPLTGDESAGYDPPIVTATHKATIRELKRELALIHRKAVRIEIAIRSLEALEETHGTEAESGRKASAAGDASYPEATRTILDKANRALTVRQILDALAKSGRPISTTKPYRTLYKVLRSHPEMFANVDGKWRSQGEK